MGSPLKISLFQLFSVTQVLRQSDRRYLRDRVILVWLIVVIFNLLSDLTAL